MSQQPIKLIIPLVVFPLLLVGLLGTAPGRAAAGAQDFDAAAYYRTGKCAMCHTLKAGKHFDTSKSDDTLVKAILNGVKPEKPPFMPAYESKGVTDEHAKALVAYMRSLGK